MKHNVIVRSLACLMFLVYADSVSVAQEALPFSAGSAIRPSRKALKPIGFTASKSVMKGTASWYSKSDPGIRHKTANGEIFDDAKLTCASWKHAFGTRLRVTNLENNKSVICTVNDRGPAKRLNRTVDLTKQAFKKIADLKPGVIRVRVAVAGRKD